MTKNPTDATTDSSALDGLHGEALDRALARRFALAVESVTVRDRVYTLHKPANADHLISEADYVMDERLPYWADLWPSSAVLASAMLDDRGADRSLLELGCGIGLATTAALDAGFQVTATDYYQDALHVTRANAARNLDGREPLVRLVNWRQWPDDIGQFDVVIGADIIYEQEYSVLIADCLSRALAPKGVAIIADPGRTALAEFLDVLAARSLRIGEHRTIPFADGAVTRAIQLLRIERSDDPIRG